jgi:hypothetical protein
MFPLSLFLPLIGPLVYLSSELPLWVPGCGLTFIAWRFLSDFRKFKLPSKTVTGILSAFCFLLILGSFETWIGKDAAGSFLYLLTGLKILEYRKHEESPFLIQLGLFLNCTVFLFSLNLFWTLGLGISILALTYQLIPLNLRIKSPTRTTRLFFSTVAGALPLTLLLFFFFPRFTNVLWDFRKVSQSTIAQSGSSESLDPGSFSEVVKSNKLVFQAEFLLGQKYTRDLYWRGDVFTKPVGFSWKKSDISDETLLQPIEDHPLNHHLHDYRVLLVPQTNDQTQDETSNDRPRSGQSEEQGKLFVLDETDSVQVKRFRVTKQSSGTFRVSPVPEKALEYFGSIEYKFPVEEKPKNFLTLPPQFSNRIRQLITSWNMKTFSPEQKLERILTHFRKEKFHYSVRPGGGGNLTLERFLFETREGFCEHYASTLALLLRASGVPARVVAGYQGGTLNEFQKFWVIREKDAHAWVEYVNSKGRWARADATAEVAPLRLEIGAEEYFNLPAELQILRDFGNSLTALKKGRSIYQSIGFWIEGINYRWTTWLLNFDLNKQRELLKKIPTDIVTTIAFLVCLALALALLTHHFRSRSPGSIEDKYLKQILSWKEFEGLGQQIHLGPLETLSLAEARLSPPQRETLTKSLRQFFETYIQITYGSQFEKLPLLKTQFKTLMKLHRRSISK